MNDVFENMNSLLLEGEKNYLQNVSVDNVILGYHDKELKVLLQKPSGIKKWMLPGGHIQKQETVESAAARVAFERTNLDDLYLKQFKVFSNPDRTKDKIYSAEDLSKLTGLNIDESHWLMQPFITIGFYTLTEFSKVTPSGNYFMEDSVWWPVNELPELVYDHKYIIDEAIKALRIHITFRPIGLKLLPEKFTLPELRILYETILGKELDDRNFSKKFINAGILEKLDEKRQIKGHRKPNLFKFNIELYMEALENGININ